MLYFSDSPARKWCYYLPASVSSHHEMVAATLDEVIRRLHMIDTVYPYTDLGKCQGADRKSWTTLIIWGQDASGCRKSRCILWSECVKSCRTSVFSRILLSGPHTTFSPLFCYCMVGWQFFYYSCSNLQSQHWLVQGWYGQALQTTLGKTECRAKVHTGGTWERLPMNT